MPESIIEDGKARDDNHVPAETSSKFISITGQDIQEEGKDVATVTHEGIIQQQQKYQGKGEYHYEQWMSLPSRP